MGDRPNHQHHDDRKGERRTRLEMKRFSKTLTPFLPAAVLLICFWWPSFYGLNFGTHWDEDRAKFDSIRDSLRTGLFIQAASLTEEGGNYNYGGVNYLLTWAGFAPEIFEYLYKGPRTREALSQVITPILYTTASRIRVRAIYVILSSLAIVWVFCLALFLGRSRLEAFVAAAILSCSWEVAYHSRWIAPDAVMMQFAALAFFCLAIGIHSKRQLWFYFGAIATGLAVGTKYPAGLVLPFFLAGAALTFVHHRVRHSLGLTGTALLTFVLTSPGVLIDPFRFFNQLRDQREIYTSGWFGYTVTPGIKHLLGMLKYFSIQMFSHYWSISIVFAAFCLLGIVSLVAERKLFTFLAAGFCAAYLIFFSQEAVMIVRNLLVIAPFLALAAARGIAVAAESLRRRGTTVVYSAVGILLATNWTWQVYAARQIKLRHHPEHYLKMLVNYANHSPRETFLISRSLSRDLHGVLLPLPANVVTDVNVRHTKVAFLQSESAYPFSNRWPSNAWGLYEKVFAPLEVNIEAYSTFIGNERILLVSSDKFKELPMKEADLSSP
jgi:4-amino-4-deoxy-L-arabinose transferase-like glycosyltransferase